MQPAILISISPSNYNYIYLCLPYHSPLIETPGRNFKTKGKDCLTTTITTIPTMILN